MNTPEIDTPCVGVCMVDASGYCLGCGRPPQGVPPSAPQSGDDARADWRSANQAESINSDR